MMQPDWESFGKAIMRHWPAYDVDGGTLQELAEKHGLISKVPGGYNPEKHYDEYCCAEPGDDWYKLNFEPETDECTA